MSKDRGESLESEQPDESVEPSDPSTSRDVDESDDPTLEDGPVDGTDDGVAPASDERDPDSVSDMSCEEALESAVLSLELVTAERDDYLDTLQRVKADFDNFRRRTETQRSEQIERAAEGLASELLSVLDACEAAISHGAEEVEPIHSMMLSLMTSRGLEAVGEEGDDFDPNLHEAVASEPADEGQDKAVISEMMRSGYLWNGRVLRPAMVKVKGN